VSVQTDEPYAYWLLDEVEGTTDLKNSGTEVVSANYSGSLTLGQPGLSDPNRSAVRFAGSDGLVQVPNNNFMNVTGPWEEKTIELWFSADEADTLDEQVLFEQGGTTRGLNIYIRENKVFVGGWNAANNDNETAPWPGGTDLSDPANALFVSAPIDSNTAYHVALVMDGDAEPGSFMGTLTGYLNGEVFGEETGVGRLFEATNDSSIGATSAQTFFDTGRNQSASTNNFVGVIDEVALYNHVLAAEVIFQHAGNDEVDLPGDFNLDGNLDFADFMLLTDNFGGKFSKDEAPGKGDINRDLTVDMKDFRDFRAAFSALPAAAQSTSIPEPTSISLLGLGLLSSLIMRRRTRCTIIETLRTNRTEMTAIMECSR
jgi:hypothetical protein